MELTRWVVRDNRTGRFFTRYHYSENNEPRVYTYKGHATCSVREFVKQHRGAPTPPTEDDFSILRCRLVIEEEDDVCDQEDGEGDPADRLF